MSIYNRALRDAPQVDRRIVRAVDRVLRSLPASGGVFGRVDVWEALQASAREARVPLDLDAAQVARALDALCLAEILTCRGGAYTEGRGGAYTEVAPAPAEVPAEPASAPEPENLPRSLAEVAALLREGPMSAADIRAALGATPSTITTRLSRLMQCGMVRKGAQIPSTRGGLPQHFYEIVPPDARVTPNSAEARCPPPPVKADPWTARPKEGPDEHGRWRWEARATLETRVSRGLGWLAEEEVLRALVELDRPAADAACGQTSDAWVHADHMLDSAHVPEGPILERLQVVLATWERARGTGPAWPSLRDLDVDSAEGAIGEIERRCAAWRALLQAAREVAA